MQHSRRSSTAITVLLLAGILGAFRATVARATTYTWDIAPSAIGTGNGAIDDGSGTWDTALGNWTADGGLSDVAWPSNLVDVARFGGATGGTIVVSESLPAGGLLFDGSGPGNYVVSGAGGQTLALGPAGIAAGAGTGDQTLDGSLNVLLKSSQVWRNEGACLLSVNSPVTATNLLTLTVNGPGAVSIGGMLSDAGVTLSLAKNSPGTLTIHGATHSLGASSTTSPGLSVNGGGTLFIGSGVNDFGLKAASRGGSAILVGNTSANNTLVNGGGILRGYGLLIGEGTAGNNHAIFTRPGSDGDETLLLGGNGQTIHVGESSSFNSLEISNGAYVKGNGGYGTTFFEIGGNAGADNNTVSVSGAGSTLVNYGQRVFVGGAGAQNTLTASGGGQVNLRVLHVGNGGSNNTTTVTGNGSYLSASECTYVGLVAAGTDNSLIVSGGAAMFTKGRITSRDEKALLIGGADAANRNSVTVTGSGSLLTVGSAPSTDYTAGIGVINSRLGTNSVTATNNSFNVHDGGKAVINYPLLVGGAQSAFNLGNGSALCTAAVHSVSLLAPDARLTINGGELQAVTGGQLISGSGVVQAAGPAALSTDYTNSIDSVIAGGDGLTKRGTGTLALTAANTYAGGTAIEGGTLELAADGAAGGGSLSVAAGATCAVTGAGNAIADSAYVHLSGTMLLGSGVNETARRLYIDGSLQIVGVWNAARDAAHFAGDGNLIVTEGVPDVPAGLSAAPGDARVDLSWNAAPGATSYKVKRATTGGGPYSVVATSAGTTCADTTAANGTTYYYVVSAANDLAESADSSEVSAKPMMPIPPAPAGLSASAGNAFVNLAWASSAGAATYNVKRATASGGPYTLVGAVSATALTDNTVVNGTTYYYVVSAVNMAGESPDSTETSARPLPPLPSVPAALSASGTNALVNLSWTASSWAASYSVKRSLVSGGPYAVVGTAAGTTYADSAVTNGVTYYYVVSALNAAGESGNSSQTSARPMALPSPWLNQDIGTVGKAGSAGLNNGVFTVIGAGADIGGKADSFQYAYMPASGDCEIKARVTSVQNTQAAAKAGVMIRESLAANARSMALVLTPGNGLMNLYRFSAGGNAGSTTVGGVSAPAWVRLVRTGKTFVSYRSANGATWTPVSTQSISMATSVYIGLPVCSRNTNALCTATMDNVTAVP